MPFTADVARDWHICAIRLTGTARDAPDAETASRRPDSGLPGDA